MLSLVSFARCNGGNTKPNCVLSLDPLIYRQPKGSLELGRIQLDVINRVDTSLTSIDTRYADLGSAQCRRPIWIHGLLEI